MACGIYGLIRGTLREWYATGCTSTLEDMGQDMQWILQEFPAAPEYEDAP